MTTYSVVVESGSCDMKGERWEERAHCGHKHTKLYAALECKRRLTRYSCKHGRPSGALCKNCSNGRAARDVTSAKWYNARIHDQDHRRVDEERSQ